MYLLSDLWQDCFASEVLRPKPGSEGWQLMQSMAQKRERIMAELSEEGRQLFEAFERAQKTLADLKEEDTCIRAFRMGAKMMADIYGDYRSPFET